MGNMRTEEDIRELLAQFNFKAGYDLGKPFAGHPHSEGAFWGYLEALAWVLGEDDGEIRRRAQTAWEKQLGETWTSGRAQATAWTDPAEGAEEFFAKQTEAQQKVRSALAELGGGGPDWAEAVALAAKRADELKPKKGDA